jgi:O-methyltransferase involved in polyketide biosynthesis
MLNKNQTIRQNLSGVSDSLFLPLYIRAHESQRPDAILRDEWAVEVVQKLKLDAAHFEHAQLSEEVQVSVLLRNRQFDRITRNYLSHHPDSVVVYLGCGLDTRFERVDNGQVEWYDLDLPEVIQWRRELNGGESCRYEMLACSALDHTWMEVVSKHHPHSFLFLAEGLFMFFEEAQVKKLVLELKDRFHASELVFDAFSPFYVWGKNRRVTRTKVGTVAHWSLKQGKDLEKWSEGIRLLNEWYPFLCPEPRLAHIRWVRFVPLLSKTTGIFHYQLG